MHRTLRDTHLFSESEKRRCHLFTYGSPTVVVFCSCMRRGRDTGSSIPLPPSSLSLSSTVLFCSCMRRRDASSLSSLPSLTSSIEVLIDLGVLLSIVATTLSVIIVVCNAARTVSIRKSVANRR